MSDNEKINTGNDADDYHKETALDLYLMTRYDISTIEELFDISFDYGEMQEAFKAGVAWAIEHYDVLTQK